MRDVGLFEIFYKNFIGLIISFKVLNYIKKNYCKFFLRFLLWGLEFILFCFINSFKCFLEVILRVVKSNFLVNGSVYYFCGLV